MTKTKQHDLEERTFDFAKRRRKFSKRLHKSIANTEDVKQLVRSSGSVGANYIEANEALSKKDFLMRVKICRKEVKESRYWLALLDNEDNQSLKKESQNLQDEATELLKAFSSIIQKSD